MAETRRREARGDLERRAWDMRVRELRTLRSIADELGVADTTVLRALRRVEQRLAAEFAEQAAEIRARQVAQLEALAEDALAEYQRSKLPAEVEIETRGPTGRTVRTETRVRTGDSALLGRAIEALAGINRLLGLEAPRRTDVTSGGKELAAYPAALAAIGTLDDAELRERLQEARDYLAAGGLPEVPRAVRQADPGGAVVEGAGGDSPGAGAPQASPG